MLSLRRPIRSGTRSGPNRVRLHAEVLEGREVPATLIGLTTANQLVTFDSATPGTLVGTAVAVTGLAGDSLVGIDYRPLNGTLYGVGLSSQVYTIAYAPAGTTAVATAVGGPFIPALNGTNFGVDFNPVADRLRIVSDTEQNLRIVPTTGASATITGDTALAYDPADPINQGFFDNNADGDFDPTTNPTPPPSAANTAITAAAYTQGFAAGTGTTTLYGIDSTNGYLVQIGSPDGTPNSPNGGQVVVVDRIRDAGFNPISISSRNGFDIEPSTDAAFVVSATAGSTTLYSLNLTTATAASVGTVGSGLTLTGLTIAPPAAGNSTIQLTANAATFPANRGPLAVSVTRTGGLAGTATVNFATTDGTAVAGVDYLPTSGTLTFGPGEASKTIFLLLPSTANPPPSPIKTFTLTLSNSTGTGVTLGGTTSATFTIPAVVASPTPTRFFAIASGAGGDGRVFVYDAISRTQAFILSPFGAGFSLGQSVAVADVNRDGFDDIIVGAGSGGGPRAIVIDGQSRTVVANFFAYDPSFRGGVNVAAGDVNGDGFADVILGAGDGGGPQVRVVSGINLSNTTQTQLASFFAYDAAFRGGVNVGAGEFTGDAFSEIVTGAGNGGGPVVRIFNGQTLAPIATYFAYDGAFRGGVYVTTGDVDGVNGLDLVTGTGPSGGPNVRVFRGTGFTPTASFFAYSSTLIGGVRVATSDLDSNGTADILTGAGVAGPSNVRIFNATGASNGADIQPFAAGFNGGVYVG